MDEDLAAILRAIRARGYVLPGPRRDAEMGLLFRAGVSLWEIGTAFNLGPDTIKAALRRLGLMEPAKPQPWRKHKERRLAAQIEGIRAAAALRGAAPVWVAGLTQRRGRTLEVTRGGTFIGADIWTPERIWRETNETP